MYVSHLPCVVLGYLTAIAPLDWVVGLGPQVSYDDAKCAPCYAYSIVSDKDAITLWVLARNPADFTSTYNAEVSQFLVKEGMRSIAIAVIGHSPSVLSPGFTHDYNKPVETYQSEACEYAPVPEY